MGLMKEEAIAAVIRGLKSAGVSVVSSVSTHRITNLINAIEDDPDLDHLMVAEEGDAIGICGGAYMGGKMGCFLAQNSGLIKATYQVLDSITFFGGLPMLMLIDDPGEFGSGGAAHFPNYAIQAPRILDGMNIPWTALTDVSKIEHTIKGGVVQARSIQKASAIFMRGDLYNPGE